MSLARLGTTPPPEVSTSADGTSPVLSAGILTLTSVELTPARMYCSTLQFVLDALWVVGAVLRRFLHSGALVKALGVHDNKLGAARVDPDEHARLPF